LKGDGIGVRAEAAVSSVREGDAGWILWVWVQVSLPAYGSIGSVRKTACNGIELWQGSARKEGDDTHLVLETLHS
jgi:hypothetical protein